MPRSNIFEAGAAEVPELFGDYIDGRLPDDGCHILVLYSNPVESPARNALAKSFSALGFGDNACTYACLQPITGLSTDGSTALDSQALFLLVEGLDPLRIVAADQRSTRALAKTYRTTFEGTAAIRIFGRPSLCFDDLSQLVQTESGKQKAWALFKTLAN